MTDDEIRTDQHKRGTLLSVMLALFGLGGFLLLLVIATGGWFLWVLLGVLAIAFLAVLHYLAWGRSMETATAGEREEAEVRVEAELNEWDRPEERRSRHL